MRSRVDRAYEFLTHRFLPNARDEQWVRHRLADRDHRHVIAGRELEEIDDLTNRLGALKAKLARHSSSETIRELRQVLYEISALLRLHYGALTAADTRS